MKYLILKIIKAASNIRLLCFKVLRRSSVTVDYNVPDGWHRVASCDDEDDEEYDPWFSFIQEIALRSVNQNIHGTLSKDKKRKLDLFMDGMNAFFLGIMLNMLQRG